MSVYRLTYNTAEHPDEIHVYPHTDHAPKLDDVIVFDLPNGKTICGVVSLKKRMSDQCHGCLFSRERRRIQCEDKTYEVRCTRMHCTNGPYAPMEEKVEDLL